MVDNLEEQGMETVSQRHLGRKGSDLDLVEQLNIYEMSLRHEDGDDDSQPPPTGCRDRRRVSLGGAEKQRGLERRRSRRASLGRSGQASPCSPASPHRAGFQPFSGHRAEDLSERAACPTSTVHRTTLQSITISSRTIQNNAQKHQAEISPPSTSSPSTPTPPSTEFCSLGPQTQPSLLATLLARKRSTVTVPATKEVSLPLRGSSRPSPDHMPYLPHSPFHLFSYDLDGEPAPSAQAKRSEESPKTTPPRNGGGSYSSLSTPSTPTSSRVALGGLLSSSYRQHQESLAAERERRRVEREERLQRIEREERNKHSRDYVDKMEEARLAREER
ncbi:hypothetical protein XENORESO_001944, partial [Xenotaenia resolanae]